MKNIRKYYSFVLLLGFVQLTSIPDDYSKMSVHELNEALVVAVKDGRSADVVRELIQAGANINQNLTYIETHGDCDWWLDETLLEHAIRNNYQNVAKVLLKVEAENNINRALILAAGQGYVSEVKDFLQAVVAKDIMSKAFIACVDRLPRCNASTYDDYVSTIDELLKAGADVNYANEYGSTALISVAIKNNVSFIKELIKLGADVNHANHDGCTAFIKAASYGYVDVIKELVKAGADVNYADKYGNTALIDAIKKHDFDTVKILLELPKIKINHANHDGNTAFIIAIQSIEYTYWEGDKKQYQNCIDSQNILEQLAQTPGINYFHVNKNGDTAISLLEKLDDDMNRY